MRVKAYVLQGWNTKIDIFYGEECSKETFIGSISIGFRHPGGGKPAIPVIVLPKDFPGICKRETYNPFKMGKCE